MSTTYWERRQVTADDVGLDFDVTFLVDMIKALYWTSENVENWINYMLCPFAPSNKVYWPLQVPA